MIHNELINGLINMFKVLGYSIIDDIDTEKNNRFISIAENTSIRSKSADLYIYSNNSCIYVTTYNGKKIINNALRYCDVQLAINKVVEFLG